ncbi:MAG: hypothetical protein HY064_12395 [Bacteroidetes bacterium]|nr:hypothetical protein [Bacteroidota bacterium]
MKAIVQKMKRSAVVLCIIITMTGFYSCNLPVTIEKCHYSNGYYMKMAGERKNGNDSTVERKNFLVVKPPVRPRAIPASGKQMIVVQNSQFRDMSVTVRRKKEMRDDGVKGNAPFAQKNSDPLKKNLNNGVKQQDDSMWGMLFRLSVLMSVLNFIFIFLSYLALFGSGFILPAALKLMAIRKKRKKENQN